MVMRVKKLQKVKLELQLKWARAWRERESQLWRLRNERRISILMTRHYPDLGSTSKWLKQISHAARPIRSSGGVAKCRLFSQAKMTPCSPFSETYHMYNIMLYHRGAWLALHWSINKWWPSAQNKEGQGARALFNLVHSLIVVEPAGD